MHSKVPSFPKNKSRNSEPRSTASGTCPRFSEFGEAFRELFSWFRRLNRDVALEIHDGIA